MPAKSHFSFWLCIQTVVLGNEKIACLALCKVSKTSNVQYSVLPGLLCLFSQVDFFCPTFTITGVLGYSIFANDLFIERKMKLKMMTTWDQHV